MRGTNALVKNQFYLYHLWNYIAGSIIDDNYLFLYGPYGNGSILYKLCGMVSAPLNLFVNTIIGKKLFRNLDISFRPVHILGEKSNVVDCFGYLYPSNSVLYAKLLYYAVILCAGILAGSLYKRAMRKKNQFYIDLSVFLTFFLFFSFFGPFYVNLPPWEILLWSCIMPRLFKREMHATVKLKIIR